MRTIAILLVISTAAFADSPGFVITDAEPQGFVITETFLGPPAAGEHDPSSSPEQPAVVVPISVTDCDGGYCWAYSNGATLNETYLAYSLRTGKPSPATQFQCSTGYCGTAASMPTIASSGCRCGCNAASCSCAHSPNVGKPLKEQSPRASTAVETDQHGYSSTTTNVRGRLFSRLRLFRR